MDDLTAGLAKARRQPWLTRSTGVMIGLVLVCGGFLAGVKVQQTYGAQATTAGATTGGGARAQLQQQQQQQQQPGSNQAAASTTGKVKLIAGTTVYIETADGRTITVRTTDKTVIAEPSKLTDLAVGASVTVQGSGTETITATSIIKTDQ